jgi:hypothetical protein
MLKPFLLNGMKEGNNFPGLRVHGCYPILFDQVTIPAGKTEIPQVICTAQGFGNDVIDGELHSDDLLLGLAITAPVIRPFGKELTLRGG